MQVRQGWSGEVEPNRWAKFDVELDENDLRRLFIEAGIDFVTDLTTAEAFQLLETEAERLVIVKLITRYNYPQAEGSVKLQRLPAARNVIIDAIKNRDQLGDVPA